MPIEFSCPECGKLLSTGDDKAGRSAKCPGCSAPITVPGTPPSASLADARGEDSRNSGDDQFADGNRGDEVRRPCPVCGELILARAQVCRFCGEQFSRSSGGGPVGLTTDMDVIWQRTWATYKENLGITVALVLLSGVINFVASLPQNGLRAAFDRGLLEPVAFFPSFGAALLTGWAVQFWISAGLARCMLKLARGDTPEVSELFSGARWFWRTTGSSIVFFLAVYVGLALCIAPGILAALALWPYLYFIVDDDDGVTDSLNRAFNLTTGNYVLGLQLGLYTVGLGIVGVAMCCVGLVFTMPLASLLSAMTYLALRQNYRGPRADDGYDDRMV